MGALFDRVREAEECNRKMYQLVSGAAEEGDLEVFRLRSGLTRAILGIMNEYNSAKESFPDPSKQRDFDRLFGEMRSTLSAHQGEWQPQAIARDPAGYKKSAANVNEKQVAFYKWCNSNLR